MALYTRSLACVLRNGATPVAAAPAVQRLEIPQDSDAEVLLSIVDEAGAPVDITNAPITFTIKLTAAASTAVVSRLAVVTDGEAGLAVVQLAQLDTAFASGSYFYDVQLEEAGSGLRTQVVPYSPFSLLPSLGRVGAPVDSLVPSAVVAYGLPTLAGNAGRVLSTNGTGLTWVNAGAGGGGSAHIIQSNGVSQVDRSNLNFNSPLVASDDSVNDQTDVSLATTGPGAVTTGGGANFINSITTDAFGRVASLSVGTPVVSAYTNVKNSSGGSLAQRTNLKFDGGFSVADTAPDTVITLQSVGTPGTYSSVTTDSFGRVTAGTNPGYLTSAFYQTVKNSAGAGVAQRGALKFGTDFAVIDSAPDTVLSLASNALTVTAGTGLAGGGSVALGSSTTLSLPATGPGATTTGGGTAFINTIQTDAQGRIVALTTGVPSTGASGYSLIQGNGTPLTQRTTFNVLPRLVAADDAPNSATTLDLASGVATPGTYSSLTVDTYGRVTAGSNPGFLTSAFYQTVKNTAGTASTQRSVLKFDGGFTVADVSSETVVALNATGVSAGTFTSLTVGTDGRVTAATNPGFLTQAYATIKNSAGTAQTQRSSVKFGTDFAVSDSSPDTVIALASNSLTVTAGTGLTDGGLVALGGSVSLSLPATGPGAGTSGGGASYINSVTLDAQGRVTALTTGTPSGGGSGYTTVQANGSALTQRAILNVLPRLTTADDGTSKTTLDLASGIVSTGTYTSVTVDTYGRVTAGTNPGFLTSAFYQTVKNSAGTGQTQRANLKFDSGFAVADSTPDTVVSLSTTGVGAGTYTSVTVATDGRVTAGSNPGFLTSAFYQTVQANGSDLTQRAKLNVLPRLTAADNGTLTTLDLTSGVVSTGTYSSVTVDTYGRVTAGTNPGYLTAAYVLVKDSTGTGATARANLKFGSAFTVTDTTPDTVVTLSDTGVSASTYTSVTVDAKGRVTAGTSPGFLTSAFYQTVKDSTGTGATQRANVKFGSNFVITDTSPDTVITLSTTGVSASTYTSVTVDTFGRVTAGSNPSVFYQTIKNSAGTGQTQRSVLKFDAGFTLADVGSETVVSLAGGGGGSGTVTSITAGTGLSASPSSPITTSGTLSVDQSFTPTWTGTHTYSALQTWSADNTYDIGDATHRAANIFTRNLKAGANQLVIQSSIANGSTPAIVFNSGATFSTNKVFDFRNNGVSMMDIYAQGGTSYIEMNDGTTGVNVGYIAWSSGGISFYNGGQSYTFGAGNNVANLGSSTFNIKTISCYQYLGVEQTITVTTTGALTINPTLGEVVRIVLQNSPGSCTLSAGAAGQVIRIEWIQDATGGRSLPSTGNMTNFRLGATGTGLTSTASKRDIWTMMYDATNALWYEVARVQNL